MIIEAKIGDNWQISKFANLKLVLSLISATSELWKGSICNKKGAVRKVLKSMIAPHTLSNFQSLTKLIALIINHFYSHCRGDWQIAFTKQNFSDSLCM